MNTNINRVKNAGLRDLIQELIRFRTTEEEIIWEDVEQYDKAELIDLIAYIVDEGEWDEEFSEEGLLENISSIVGYNKATELLSEMGLAATEIKIQGMTPEEWREQEELKASEKRARKNSRRFADDDVREMRRVYEQERLSYAKIGARYGCSGVFVRNVVLRNLYKDVE